MSSSPFLGVTWLFVPGDRPDRFDRAVSSGADRAICDLEDAVAAQKKTAARDDVVTWLSAGNAAWVRINGADTRSHDDDIAALAGLPGLLGVMVPRSEDAANLAAIRDRLNNTAIVALVETALGVHQATTIALCDAVDRLAFGSIDFGLDVDADESDEALLFARSSLVIASRVANKPAPLDGATTTITEPSVAQEAARRARQLGFGGKLCIHPSQVKGVAAAFRPTEDEIDWATRVLDAVGEADGAAVAVDGAMVDRPVVERARRILGRVGL